MNKQTTQQVNKRNSEAGFSLIEAVCAIAILTIGLVTTAFAISSALKFNQINKNITQAKDIVLSQIEEIHSLRDTGRLRFSQLVNNNTTAPVGGTGGTVPFTGFRGPLTGAPTNADFYPVSTIPGTDGVYGTIDDPGPFREGFTKSVVIREINPNLKRVDVFVRYPGAEGQTYQLGFTSVLNNDIKQ